jgi:hypothetical protein
MKRNRLITNFLVPILATASMNKYLLIFLFFSSWCVKAQTYVPMISTTDSSDTWMDVHSCTDFNCYFTQTRRYTIDSDTVIGLNQYTKLIVKQEYEEGADQSQWCNESSTISTFYYGAIRESGKQVFVTPAWDSEYLAYDFNLNIGDTIPSPAGFSGNESLRIINSIDSVLINANYRKRFWIENNACVIEGIGASSGLFNPVFDPFEPACDIRMLCYTEYEAPAYFDFNCNMNLGLEDFSESLETPSLLKIVDAMGREIEEMPNTLMIYIYGDGTSKKVFRLE